MTHMVISNSMLAAAGGRLDPAYWLALKQIADVLGKPLHADTIPDIVAEGERIYKMRMTEARVLRDKANEILEVARGIEAEVLMLNQFTNHRMTTSGVFNAHQAIINERKRRA